ncbi:MAG TPA: aspartate kinase [Bacillales bacterium]|nr:aspartate kinase [Bacillales bacterium]
MKMIVQKFGGTSLKGEKDRERALSHVGEAVKDGYKVVVVVSAMGRTGDPYATDTLLGLVNEDEMKINNREWDMLASCGEVISSVVFANMLNNSGLKATALTGAQAGFRTNDVHRNAKIIDMKCERLKETLEHYDVAVVAGFQGRRKNGDVTTIGRGGSDTSAAALGAALNAEWIDIFTDVDGVMTADPRIVSQAQSLSVVTYNEICNLAYQGAKVIHPRAVEIAMESKVPIRIRSTHSDSLGTLVTSINADRPGRDIQERLITGIAHSPGVSQIRVLEKEGLSDLQSKVFKAMAENNVSVDLININPNGVVYTVTEEMTNRAVTALQEIGYEPEVIPGCAKVSAVGAGMNGIPGVASKIVSALASQGIQILQSADSHTTIWVLVKQDDVAKAVNALHETFELNKIHEKSGAPAEKNV